MSYALYMRLVWLVSSDFFLLLKNTITLFISTRFQLQFYAVRFTLSRECLPKWPYPKHLVVDCLTGCHLTKIQPQNIFFSTKASSVGRIINYLRLNRHRSSTKVVHWMEYVSVCQIFGCFSHRTHWSQLDRNCYCLDSQIPAVVTQK